MTSDQPPRIAFLVARFNGLITGSLLRGGRAAARMRGCASPDVYYCGGAFELPVMARRLLNSEERRPDAIVALGCVVRGHTPHFDYVAGEAASGLSRVAADSGVPVAFGVLTTDTIEQALKRVSGVATNKGWEATLAVLDVLDEVPN